MKAKSCFSTNMDPYRAGIEIGEELIEINPEIIFLFPTIHYKGSSELTEAIYDVLETDDTVLIGNTGDGFYEANKVAGVGVSALGINSGGSIKWLLAYESGVGESPFETTKHCISRLNKLCKPSKPAIYFLASDFRTDASQINSALQEKAMAPVVGGLAGDDYKFENCFVYANRKVLTDTIAILAMVGEFSYDISLAHNLQPVGKTGVITKTEGTTVRSIDNISAMTFMERELGKPFGVVDEGIITLKLMEQNDNVKYRIRSLLLTDDKAEDNGVKLFGGVEQGNQAQVCLASPDRIIQAVKDVADSLSSLSFEPIAAIIVSCAGRKKVLTENIKYEVEGLISGCQSIKALAGFPSFGEFGPIKGVDGYSQPLFHNMTFILLLIGETNK